MLLEKIIFGRLEDGRYEVKLKDYKEKEGKNGKDNYLSIELKFDNGRIVKDIWFTSSLDVKANQLHQQLNLNSKTPLNGILSAAQNKESISIWVSHAQANGKIYRNINYQAPTYTPSSSTSDAEIDDDF